jgi:hypothetical protein
MTPLVVGFHVKAFVRSRQRQASSAQYDGSHCLSPDKAPGRESLHTRAANNIHHPPCLHLSRKT